MNAYERERAECGADEEARADQRLQAWRRRHTSALAVHPSPLSRSGRTAENPDRLRKAG
jgi:hypothetical protein